MREPTITIVGRAWRVPFLAPRQNRIVIPALMQLGTNPLDRYEALLDIVFAALTRARPDIQREDFEEWPIPAYELVDALPIISKQTGLLKTAKHHSTTPPEPPNWDAIISTFCNFLPGTTPDYWEDALTGPRLEAMNAEWRLHPPVAVLVAGYLDYKPQPKDEDALAELLAIFPDGRLRAATMH